MTSSVLSVIEQQTRWATNNGFVTRNAYVTSLTDNLRRQLSSGALRNFERGSGGELRQRGIRPPKMHALRSSSALSVNVFDYWCSRDPRPLQRAFGLRDRITAVTLEKPVSPRLPGNPPYVGVVPAVVGNQDNAIFSKVPQLLDPLGRTVASKYFVDGAEL